MPDAHLHVRRSASSTLPDGGAIRAAGPPAQRPGRRLVGALAAAAVAVAALLLWLGRDRTFFFDEWDWVQGRSSGGLGTLLEPHNEHISVVPVAIYRVLFETAGIGHTWPFRLAVVLVHLGCVALLFELVRRRAGHVAGAIAAVLLLTLGRAWEDLLWGFQLGFLTSVLGGLVALWALDRGRHAVACAALVIAAASSSLGVPVVVGVGVELLVARRLRFLWVPAVPLALYALWYLLYGTSAVTGEGIVHAPPWAADAAAAAAGGLFGRGLDWGRPLLTVLAGLAAWAIVRHPERVSPRLLGVLAGGAAFWMATGAARSSGATPVPPDTSRYVYLGAVVLLLAAAELLRGRKLPRAAYGVAAAVAAIAVAQSLSALRDGAVGLRQSSDTVKAQIAAAELVAPALPAELRFAPQAAPQLVAFRYLAAVDRERGDPVPDPVRELREAGGEERRMADDVFVSVSAALEPAPGPAPACAPAPAGRELTAPRGGLVLRAGSAPVEISVRRYGALRPLDTIPAGETRRLRLRPDPAPEPWRVSLSAPAGTCSG